MAIIKDEAHNEGNLRGSKRARALQDVASMPSTVTLNPMKQKPKVTFQGSLKKRKREDPKSAQAIAADTPKVEQVKEPTPLETLCPVSYTHLTLPTILLV